MCGMIRQATHDDIPAIVAMARGFVTESVEYGMEFDAEASKNYLCLLLNHPDECQVFVTDDVSAVAIALIAHDWCKRPVCYVEKLFLTPSCRGTGAARELVKRVIEYAASNGCSHVFATSTAGMGHQVERMFVNLFRKFGFSECGPVLARSF